MPFLGNKKLRLIFCAQRPRIQIQPPSQMNEAEFVLYSITKSFPTLYLHHIIRTGRQQPFETKFMMSEKKKLYIKIDKNVLLTNIKFRADISRKSFDGWSPVCSLPRRCPFISIKGFGYIWQINIYPIQAVTRVQCDHCGLFIYL